MAKQVTVTGLRESKSSQLSEDPYPRHTGVWAAMTEMHHDGLNQLPETKGGPILGIRPRGDVIRPERPLQALGPCPLATSRPVSSRTLTFRLVTVWGRLYASIEAK
jgi:hypothetical protein